MTHAIRIHATGGPEVLRWEPVEPGEPGPGQIRVRHAAVGLNFIDVYYRTGVYAAPALPFTPGTEACGVVEAVGPEVADLAVGDRVAYATGPLGAYSEARVMPASVAVKVPDAIADDTAAAMMLKGLTAQYLLRRTYPVKPGDTVLIHAAAGGVGSIAVQWAKLLGARVIGTVGSEEKAARARELGCDHAIVYTREDFVAATREITDGAGVDVVYDSVGQATFLKSLDCLRPLGMAVLFGQSSGKVAPFDLGLLAAKGSLFVTRPSLFAYCAKREDLVRSAEELFDVVARGKVKIEIGQRFALKDAGEAQRALEARETQGPSVLVV